VSIATDPRIEAAADGLATAARDRRTVEPLSDAWPDLGVDAAYAIQDALVARHVADGATVVGAKLGLTSRAKQAEMGVHEPIGGWLTDRMALGPGEPLVVDTLGQPRCEPEIALRLARPLAGEGTTAADVLAATDAVMVAIEVLDSRYRDYRFTLPDVVADDASAARWVVGPPVDPRGLELDLVGFVFERDGALLATAAGAAVLGHPAEAVAWWVRHLAVRDLGLDAGAIVLSGALTGAVAIRPGERFRASIDRLGSLELVGA
jgi:2-oxo-3-hexenedioate decarboxylase